MLNVAGRPARSDWPPTGRPQAYRERQALCPASLSNGDGKAGHRHGLRLGQTRLASEVAKQAGISTLYLPVFIELAMPVTLCRGECRGCLDSCDPASCRVASGPAVQVAIHDGDTSCRGDQAVQKAAVLIVRLVDPDVRGSPAIPNVTAPLDSGRSSKLQLKDTTCNFSAAYRTTMAFCVTAESTI